MSSISFKTAELEDLATQLERIIKPQKTTTTIPEKEILLLKEKIDLMEHSDEVLLIKAKLLEHYAQQKHSNPILEQAISTYHEILISPQVSDDLFKEAGDKCVKLMKFRGWNGKAIRVLQILVQRFNDDLSYRKKLGVTFLSMNDNKAAYKVFDTILQKDPNDYYAQAHFGFIVKSEALEENDDKKLEKAVKLIEYGILNQPSNEQLDGLFYFHLADGFRRLGLPEKADEIYHLAVQRKIFPSFWQRSLYNEPDLKAQPIWTLEETGIGPQLKRIQTRWKDIRNEALAVLDSKTGGFINETENLKDTGYWAQFDLYIQGRKRTQNCAKTPITCSLIDSIPEIKSNRRGQVKFSVMKSGTHIHPHSGPTNCRLRAQLGLDIPKSDPKVSKLRVGDQYLSWSNGDLFVFDDSFDHEVWFENEMNASRMILIIDLWHPDLSEQQRQTLTSI